MPPYNFGNYPAFSPNYSPLQPYGNNSFANNMQPNIPQGMGQNGLSQQNIPQQTMQGLSNASRPVTNREEAISSPADFSGALMVFPDITHNKVYLKRWNVQTGSADFFEYSTGIIEQPTMPVQQSSNKETMNFVNQEDFDKLQNTVSDLKSDFEKLKKSMNTSTKAGKKNESNANDE